MKIDVFSFCDEKNGKGFKMKMRKFYVLIYEIEQKDPEYKKTGLNEFVLQQNTHTHTLV